MARWAALFGENRYTSSNSAHILRGEWNTGTDYLFLPMLIAGKRRGELSEAEAGAMAHIYASFCNVWVNTLPSLSLAQTESCPGLLDVSHLSKEGQDLIEVMTLGAGSWLKGCRRAAIASNQWQAAIELLVLESKGVTLTAEDVARVTRDPISGRPYVFDPVKRELLAPENPNALEVQPLVLPQ